MKLTHKKKLEIAKRMGGFNSKAWNKRAKAIADRVARKILIIKKVIKAKKDKKNE